MRSLPVSDLTSARFLLYKTKTVKFVTLNIYLSAIVSLHDFYGFDVNYHEKYFTKMALECLKSLLGEEVNQKMSNFY